MTQQPEALPFGRFRGVARSAITGRRESRTFDKFSDALDWAEARERAMDGLAVEVGGAPVERRSYDRPTLADYATGWAKRCGSDSAATRRAARSHARQLGAQWPHQRVHEIARPQVRAYLAELRDAGRSVPLRKGRLCALRAIMAAAVEDGLRDDDPTVGIPNPTASRISTRFRVAVGAAALPDPHGPPQQPQQVR